MTWTRWTLSGAAEMTSHDLDAISEVSEAVQAGETEFFRDLDGRTHGL